MNYNELAQQLVSESTTSAVLKEDERFFKICESYSCLCESGIILEADFSKVKGAIKSAFGKLVEGFKKIIAFIKEKLKAFFGKIKNFCKVLSGKSKCILRSDVVYHEYSAVLGVLKKENDIKVKEINMTIPICKKMYAEVKKNGISVAAWDLEDQYEKIFDSKSAKSLEERKAKLAAGTYDSVDSIKKQIKVKEMKKGKSAKEVLKKIEGHIAMIEPTIDKFEKQAAECEALAREGFSIADKYAKELEKAEKAYVEKGKEVGRAVKEKNQIGQTLANLCGGFAAAAGSLRDSNAKFNALLVEMRKDVTAIKNAVAKAGEDRTIASDKQFNTAADNFY